MFQRVFRSCTIAVGGFSKISSCMCKTVDQRYIIGIDDAIIRRVRICLQRSIKIHQHFSWTLTAPAWLVIKNDKLVNTILIEPVIPAMSASFLVFIQHRHRSLVSL